MYPNRRYIASTVLLLVAGMTAWSVAALSRDNYARFDDDSAAHWWLSAGLGSAAVSTDAPAPSAGRKGVAASIDFGYRFTPEWGLGFEYGGVAPLSGCTVWACADSTREFAPNFTRLMAFGEYRPRQTGWRFRAGAGVSRFCFRRHWSNSAWGWADTVEVVISAILDDEYADDPSDRDGGWRCDARTKALGGLVSMGYDWRVADAAPVTMGVRLTAEAARFAATPSIGVPAFRHRALMLTLQLNIN